MELKLKVSTLKECLLIWTIVWMVLLSKTVYFGIINKSMYQWVLYASGMICGILYGLSLKRLLRQVKLVSPFIVFLIINAAFYLEKMSSESINELVGVALFFLVVAFICSYLKREKFAKYYIYIMAVICLISIPCFIIANMSEPFAMSLCQPGYDWKSRFGYAFFYTWGWNGSISSRNAGPFWEPGAFQGFILIGILFLLHGVCGKEILYKRKKWLLMLFIFTIVTTGSTTGYILIIVVLLSHWSHMKELFSDLSSSIKYIVLFFICLLVIGYIILSGNIESKLSGSNTKSASIRYMDLTNGVLMWKENPILGLGLTEHRQLLRETLGVSTDDSVGLSFMAYTYGIPFLLYYIYRLLEGIKNVFRAKGFNLALLFFVFIVLNLTEGVWWLPIYLCILFIRY